MLRGSQALEKAMYAGTKSLHDSLEQNSADLARTIERQNELSPEITSLSRKHRQLSREHEELSASLTRQFSARSEELRATAGLLAGPDMKMSAMLGPQQARARAILADIVTRSKNLERDLANHSTALDNSLELGTETANELRKLLLDNASPRAEQMMAELDQADLQNRQQNIETKKWMEEHLHAVSRQVVENVTAMSRSSSRTRILPGEVVNTSSDIAKSVQEQLQALDALAQISGAGIQAGQTGARMAEGGLQTTTTDQHNAPSPRPPATRQQSRSKNTGKKPSQWSFGDLLARVADTDTDQDEHPLPTYRPARAQTAENQDKPELAPDPHDVLRMDDIARALDGHTAALAWRRSQAGERNVFTRRLYTPEGQITFDHVCERYQNSKDFHATVERYVTEFEGLMNEARKKDPSGRVIQNYLTSETGRAYLVLAHVSGRLG